MSHSLINITRYFSEHSFEEGGRLYKKLGIHHFKKIVPFGDYFFKLLRLFKPNLSMACHKEKVREEAVHLICLTLFVEAIHLLFFFIMIGLLIRTYLIKGEISSKSILLNMLVNVLPIMVQRYNRIRILRTFQLCLLDLFTSPAKAKFKANTSCKTP
jgi:hypothetical protein